MATPPLTPHLDHIGVQTADLSGSLAWYREYFGAKQNWTLDRFSDLTRSRLPGIIQLVELAANGIKFHLFERDSKSPQLDSVAVQFQHVCWSVESESELRHWRERWLELRESGKYTFERPDPPTEIVTDSDGVQSFYCFDVNGLEYEFTFNPSPQ